MLNFLKKIFGGTKQDRDVKSYQPLVDQINAYYEQYHSLSHDELRAKTLDFRQRIAEHLQNIDARIESVREQAHEEADIFRKEDYFKQVDELRKERDQELEVVLRAILPEAFAVVKSAAYRLTNNETLTVTATEHDRELAAKNKGYVTIEGDKAVWQNRWLAAGNEVVWNMVHYDVQLIGGMALHDGKISEMATGEGKTLVSTLPAYLNGLTGEGVHIVTVNDYLAKRDSEWNGTLFEFLLLTVDCIDKHQPNSAGRKRAYNCDITYGTNNEFGFDYLRDNMVHSLSEMVQRKHHYAMVDEVDSVLVDDARTPLIISGPANVGQETEEYNALKPTVERLIAEQRKIATNFLVDAKRLFEKGELGHEEGKAGMALIRAHRALPKNRPLIKFLSEEGVRVLLQKTENFYMQEQSKNMKVADEPLLFTIDEKNRNVELTERGAEWLSKGSGDDQFFILPDIAGSMVEIEGDFTLSKEEKLARKEQVTQEYAIKSQRLHSISQLLKAYTLFEKDEEYIVVEGEVKIVDEQTGRIMEGRRYSDGLHQALEAKENVKIGDITQTYATITLQNYFRMYHKLGGMTGTAETEASEFWQIYKLDVVTIPTNRNISRKDEDDLVYKTAREKYNAVIDEIGKLTAVGRPVLVGTTSVDISEKLSRMLSLRNIPHDVLNAKQHQREAEIVAKAGQAAAVTIATNMAGRGTDIKLGAGVKEAGGLAIIGTERHESRRVDRQLRGRAGRQGDPGTSQFFVSLEDNLMRLFQSERIAGLMDRMGHKEGEMIQHSMVTKSIERAQKKVEENNYGIRKRLIEYDDAMNVQRTAIYKKRYNALTGERLAVDLHTMFMSLTENIIVAHKDGGNFQTFQRSTSEILGFIPEISENEFNTLPENGLIEKYQEQFLQFYTRKEEYIINFLMPMIIDVQKNEGDRYERIAVPFTDGHMRGMTVAVNMKEAIESNGATIMREIEKSIALALIDEEWKEHLRNMDELKDSVQAASFEQKDPLVIYKLEAFNLFKDLIFKINKSVTSYLSKGKLIIEQAPQEAVEQPTDFRQMQTNNEAFEDDLNQRQFEQQQAGMAVSERPKVEQRIRQGAKIGRNDPCPCGSGKKYKNCHGVNEK